MGLVIGLFVGIFAGLLVPFAVRDSPGTFGGLLTGGMLWVPYFERYVHWSWAIFGLVTILVWGLLKLARGT